MDVSEALYQMPVHAAIIWLSTADDAILTEKAWATAKAKRRGITSMTRHLTETHSMGLLSLIWTADRA